MGFASILLLSLGVAMDATAVAAARGLAAPVLRLRHFVLVAAFFGGAQALMPLLGWWLGDWIGPRVAAWDHWLAFGLLGVLGLRMLQESRRFPDEDEPHDREPFGLGVLFVLAVATSIDAFAVGVTLPMLQAPFALTLATIGLTTAVASALGLVLGRRFGALFGPRLDAVGGLVLIGLGVKILVEHLVA